MNFNRLLKDNKQELYTGVLIFIVLLPNILSYFVLSSKNWIYLLFLSIFFVFLPAAFFKKKTWLKVLSIFVIFLPIEIVTLLTTNSRINNVIIASIFNTNKNEASELLSGIWLIVLFCLGLIFFYFFLLRKIKNSTFFSAKIRLGIISGLFIAFGIQYFSNFDSSQNYSTNFKQSISELKSVLSYQVYPTDLIYNTAIFTKEVVNERIAIKNLESFELNAYKTDSIPQIVIFVIGESSRAHNWSLFGYQRKTNPKLELEKNLFILPDTYSASNSTFISIPMLLSASTPENNSEWKKSGTLMNAFKEGGYYTAWFGGNSRGSSIINLANNKSDFTNYFEGFDLLLIDKAKKIIENNEGNIFIIIHTMGSHYDYQSRYPKDFEYFKPAASSSVGMGKKDEIINAYDNSVLYTDMVLSDLIDFLKSDKRPSAVYYTSDHGENLLDDERNLMFHVQTEPTKYELHVPSLFWFSDSYIQSFPEKVKALDLNKNKKMSSTVSYPSILDMGNIKYPNEDLSKSVLSPHFKAFKHRFIINNLKEVEQID